MGADLSSSSLFVRVVALLGLLLLAFMLVAVMLVVVFLQAISWPGYAGFYAGVRHGVARGGLCAALGGVGMADTCFHAALRR